MPHERKRVCVDFDGVIFPYSKGWHDGTLYEGPMPGALDGVRKLQEAGFEVEVLTARTDLIAIEEWLAAMGFTGVRVTNVKRPAVAYIDDRAIRFTNWADVVKYFC